MSTKNKDLWNSERIHKVLEFSSFAFWSLSLKDHQFYLSSQCRIMLEIPDDYVTSLDRLKDFFPGDSFSYQFSNFKKSWESGTYSATVRMTTFKKNRIWAHIHSVTEFDEKGKAVLVYGTFNDITEIKQQEERVRQQKVELERIHRLLNKTEEVGKLGHWIYNKKSSLFELSRETSVICGMPSGSFITKEVFHPYINPKNINWPAQNPPQPGTYIHEIKVGGKEEKWVEVNVDAAYEDSEAVFGTIQDISHEIKIKRKALNDEARQKAIINTIPNAFFYTDTRGIIRQVNKAFSRMVGFSQNQLIGTSIYEVLPFEDAEAMIIRDKLLLNDRQQTMEYQTKIRYEGEVRTIKIYKSTFENTSGKTLGFIGVIFDLSEEIRKSAQLKLYNKQINLAMGGANAGFFIYDIQKDINYWDEKSATMFGFPPEAVVGPFEDFLKVIHPEDREKMDSQKRAEYENIVRIDEHYRIIRNGEVRYINAQGVVERDANGQPVKILGIHFDETERKRAQRELVKSERKYRHIFESIKDGYLLINLDGQIINANPASAKLLGFKHARELIGRSFSSLCSHEMNLVQIKESLLKKKELKNLRLNLIKKNGSVIIGDFHAYVNTFDGEAIVEATFRDVTLNIQTQEQIIKATIQAEDNQRKRIAQALHDSVQQILIIAKMNFESVKGAVDSLTPEQRKRFELGMKFLNEGLNETRSVSHELMPAVVEDFGIYSILEGFVGYLNQSSDVEFHFESNVKDRTFDKQLEISLYRILQEATSNIVKYSRATEAHIQLRVSRNRLFFTIEDNGVGFDISKVSGDQSFGITGMRNRATSIGAFFELESKPGKGTVILVEAKL